MNETPNIQKASYLYFVFPRKGLTCTATRATSIQEDVSNGSGDKVVRNTTGFRQEETGMSQPTDPGRLWGR